jgi:hypothetical protein
MIHLLVGMAMGLSVLSAAVFWVNFQWTYDRQILKRTNAQQETRALMDTLVHDIRRANFQSNTMEDFSVSSQQILFSIDRNENSLKENNECSGFRFQANQIQTKTSCQPAVWTTLTQPKQLEILALELRLQCRPSLQNNETFLLIEIRTQMPSEKIPITWRRGVRLRNSDARLRNTADNCTDTAT